jgi:hypothetical protein
MMKPKNSLFGSHIQTVYEFLREIEQPRLQGNRGESIASLYHSWKRFILE